MAKRRAEDALLPDSPSKRCHRSLCSVDMQLGSMAPAAGGVSPPSLLALLGSRCRKRPYYFEDPEEQEDAAVNRRAAHWDARRPAAAVSTLQTAGSVQERRCTPTSCKKRNREDCTGSGAVVDQADEKASEDSNSEDSAYNSFQYWRPPLPELDLSLLEEDHSQTKDKSKLKDSASVAMET